MASADVVLRIGTDPVVAERDRWIRLFNRLDASVSHHRDAKARDGFCDEADEALYAARDRVISEAGVPAIEISAPPERARYVRGRLELESLSPVELCEGMGS